LLRELPGTRPYLDAADIELGLRYVPECQVLIVADGLILGMDLDTLRPKLIAVRPDANAQFVGDDTLLTGHTVDRTWEWIDLETGKRTPIALDVIGPVMGIEVDPAGRALVHELGPKGTRVHLLVRGSSQAKLIVEGASAWGRLVPGNAIIYTAGDPKIMAIVDGGEPREVAKVAGVPDGGVASGQLVSKYP
jgi:hypothetical protein